jgi:hypothetical protein
VAFYLGVLHSDSWNPSTDKYYYFFFGKLIDDETNKVSEQPYVAVTHCQGFCADLGNLIIPLAQFLLKYNTKISQNPP